MFRKRLKPNLKRTLPVLDIKIKVNRSTKAAPDISAIDEGADVYLLTY